MARWDNVSWQSRKTRSNVARDRTAQCRRQQPFQADLPLCMDEYVPNEGLDVPVTKAASHKQGLPLSVCLSGVGDLNPSWAWSQAGVRSYCHSQTLLLGCSSSQSLPCPVLLKICWVLVFCPTSPMLQETKLQNWAGEWAAAGTTAVWDLLPPGSSPAPGDSRPVSKEGS